MLAKIRRVYEDGDLLVLDKPAGLIVNRSRTTISQPTLQDWLEKRFFSPSFLKSQGEEFFARSGLVHRLDKDTSGLILVAKNFKGFSFFKEQFKKRRVGKEYFALAWGELPRQGKISFPLEKKPFSKGRPPMIVSSLGKEARTEFRREKVFFDSNGDAVLSLAKIKIFTGRTHQIRAHFFYFGFPLLADSLYAYRSRKQKRIISLLGSRLFLHASRLSINLPNGERRVFFSPLGDDLKNVILSLKKNGFRSKKG